MPAAATASPIEPAIQAPEKDKIYPNVPLMDDAVSTIEMSGADAARERIILFKTPTCPNCKAAGALLAGPFLPGATVVGDSWYFGISSGPGDEFECSVDRKSVV